MCIRMVCRHEGAVVDTVFIRKSHLMIRAAGQSPSVPRQRGGLTAPPRPPGNPQSFSRAKSGRLRLVAMILVHGSLLTSLALVTGCRGGGIVASFASRLR